MDKSVSIRAVICVHPCYGGGEGISLSRGYLPRETPDLICSYQILFFLSAIIFYFNFTPSGYGLIRMPLLKN